MVSKIRPCTVVCADSNEINYNITDSKYGQTSLLNVYLKICHDSMRQILTNIQTKKYHVLAPMGRFQPKPGDRSDFNTHKTC